MESKAAECSQAEEWNCSLVHIFVEPMPSPPVVEPTIHHPPLGVTCKGEDSDAMDSLACMSLASLVEVPGPPPPPSDASGGPISPLLGGRLTVKHVGGGPSSNDLLSISQDSGFSDAASDSAASADWGPHAATSADWGPPPAAASADWGPHAATSTEWGPPPAAASEDWSPHAATSTEWDPSAASADWGPPPVAASLDWDPPVAAAAAMEDEEQDASMEVQGRVLLQQPHCTKGIYSAETCSIPLNLPPFLLYVRRPESVREEYRLRCICMLQCTFCALAGLRSANIGLWPVVHIEVE
jgi:hypothetical protein